MKTPSPSFAASFTLRLRAAVSAALLIVATTAAAQQSGLGPAQVADPFYDRPEYYVVQKGDTLPRIADRFELDYRDLAAWNKIPENKRVAAGKRLRLYPPGRVPEQSGEMPGASTQVAAAPDAAGVTAQADTAAAQPAPPPAKKTAPKKKPAPKTAAAPSAPPATEVAAAADIPPTTAAKGTAAQIEELQHLRDTTLNLIKLLVQEGIVSQEKADALVRAAERSAITPAEIKPAPEKTAAAAATAAQAEATTVARPDTKPATDGKVVRVPYVPEVVKNEIRDQVKDEVIAQAKAEHWAEPNALPEWLDRIAFDGDLRFRYQNNAYGSGNTPTVVYNALTGTSLNNTTQDETWWRIRARLGVNATLAPDLKARLSFATGNAQNPISLNQDFGNYFSGYSVQLDNAYVRYDPAEWLSGTIGRMPKPFFSSEMVWWDDLVMDGIAATARPQLAPSVRGFVTGGAFLVQSTQSTPTTPDPKSKFLLALQGGTDWDINHNTRLKLGLAYYDFEHVEGQRNTINAPDQFDWTVPKFTQKGNTLFDINFGTGNPSKFALASKFQELNLTGALDLMHFDPYLVRVSGDYVKNLGFDRQDVLARTGLDVEPRTTGYQAQVQFGSAEVKVFRDWQVFLGYRYLQRDAVMDAFNDPDFHLGGTDTRGYTLGVRYGLATNTWVRLRYMSADEIDGPPLAIDVLQLDFNAKF